MPTYKLTLKPERDPSDPEGTRRLRIVLKRLLRNHRCKCVAIERVPEPDDTDKLIERAMLADGGNLL